MEFRENVTIVKQEQLASDVFSLWIETKDIAKNAKAGQFVSVYSNDGSRLLPRPISICQIDGNNLRMVYRTVGAGTNEFATYQAGDKLDVVGPLGNGYEKSQKSAILFGGGIGIPPMLELARELDCKKIAVLGYRDELFLNDEFLNVVDEVYIATEDGSVGTRGNVLDAVREHNLSADIVYACGPKPMLRAIKAFADEQNIEAYISLEERMACGVGACLACVCKTKNVDDHSKVNNTRICKDGPVFNAKEVEF